MSKAGHVVTIVTYLAADRESHGVTEISRELGLNKSSTYRILSSLKNAQWVVQNSTTKKYRLGIAI